MNALAMGEINCYVTEKGKRYGLSCDNDVFYPIVNCCKEKKEYETDPRLISLQGKNSSVYVVSYPEKGIKERTIGTLESPYIEGFQQGIRASIKRGDVLLYEYEKQLLKGVVIQNDAGNKFSPTIIVANVVDKKADGVLTLDSLFVHLGQIRTIDKRRVISRIGRLRKNELTQVNKALSSEFNFVEARLINVNLGNDFVGSEQGGSRPAVVLKKTTEKGNKEHYVVALLTSKMSKRSMPTHVLFEEGEGGLKVQSKALFEQLKEIPKEKITHYFEYTPTGKLPDLKHAWECSIGLKPRKPKQ